MALPNMAFIKVCVIWITASSLAFVSAMDLSKSSSSADDPHGGSSQFVHDDQASDTGSELFVKVTGQQPDVDCDAQAGHPVDSGRRYRLVPVEDDDEPGDGQPRRNSRKKGASGPETSRPGIWNFVKRTLSKIANNGKAMIGLIFVGFILAVFFTPLGQKWGIVDIAREKASRFRSAAKSFFEAGEVGGSFPQDASHINGDDGDEWHAPRQESTTASHKAANIAGRFAMGTAGFVGRGTRFAARAAAGATRISFSIAAFGLRFIAFLLSPVGGAFMLVMGCVGLYYFGPQVWAWLKALLSKIVPRDVLHKIEKFATDIGLGPILGMGGIAALAVVGGPVGSNYKCDSSNLKSILNIY